MNTQSTSPVILAPNHVNQAIGDPNFFTLMPEFLTIKKKMEVMQGDSTKGCTPCKRKRIAQSLTADFASILTSLSPDGLQRLKKYFGAEKMVVRAMNPQTGRVELREV